MHVFILLQYLSSQLSSYHVPRENWQETSIGSYFHHFPFSFRLSDFFRMLKLAQTALIENNI